MARPHHLKSMFKMNETLIMARAKLSNQWY